jgi:hypothetical protein
VRPLALFTENLRRYVNGTPWLNVVGKTLGCSRNTRKIQTILISI